MKKLLILSVIFTLFISTSAFAETIGHVKTLEGEANIVLMDGPLALQLDDKVQLNDIIETNDNSSIVIEFVDKTILALGANTRLAIDEYIFDAEGAKSNKAVFSVKKGPFHYISGLIAKVGKPNVTLKMDFGSIGVRGTKIWRDMIKDENGKELCRIYVEDGKARVYNGLGFTTLNHGDGSKIAGLKSPPTPSKPWGDKAILDIKSKSPVVEMTEEIKEPEAPTVETIETPVEAAPETVQEDTPQNILEQESKEMAPETPQVEPLPEQAE